MMVASAVPEIVSLGRAFDLTDIELSARAFTAGGSASRPLVRVWAAAPCLRRPVVHF